MSEQIRWHIYRWRMRHFNRLTERYHAAPITVWIAKGYGQKEWKAWGKVGKAWQAWRDAGGQWERKESDEG